MFKKGQICTSSLCEVNASRWTYTETLAGQHTHSVCVRGGGGEACILTSKCVTAGVFLCKEKEAVEQQAWSKEIHVAENTGCIQHT
jgi:hypothetical protein